MQSIDALKNRTTEISHLRHAAALLEWDQQTYMPPGAANARAEQLATLERLSHEMLCADETAQLIEAAAAEVGDLDADTLEAAIVRVTRRDYEDAVKLPSDFVAEEARVTALAYDVWVQARANSDYAAFQPTLERIVDLSRRRAEYLGYEDHIYDALLDLYEPGMKASDVAPLFADLREALVPFAQAIFAQQDRVSDEPLHRAFPVEQQHQLGLMIASQFGYDLQRGRQDEVVHPFCTSFSRDDVRITTRFDPQFLNPALFGTLHEAGHAMYEQGLSDELDGTFLADGVSLGIHESQSRLWENVVGRSYGFWQYFYPRLQGVYLGVLSDVSLDDFYRAINKVYPSFIRVEADEVTYPLHIMLRFELEQDILTGELDLNDAPDAWNAKMEHYLGITPEKDSDGILQDVHWAYGIFGYFPTYALGTLLSAQLYNAAVADHPEIPSDIAAGEFDTLLHWMNVNIHQHGRKYMPAELIKRATGDTYQHQPYMDYLQAKYSKIYDL
jgi:carboxypeptidase Taq